MSDQENDILDAGDAGADSEFEDFDTGSGSLSGAVKTNPLFKVGIVIAAFAVIAGGIMLFGGKEMPVDPSSVKGAAEVRQTAGSENISPVYEDAIRDKNEQILEEAQRQGTSAIPVPLGPPKTLAPMMQVTSTDDPLERWRRIQEERLRKEQLLTASQAPPPDAVAPVDPYMEQKSALASTLATQMQSILDGVALTSMKTATIADPKFIESERAAAASAASEQQVAAVAAAAAGEAVTVEVLLEPGRIEYAQLITEANTDAPGPVLAVLASGPLAGSRLIGTFSASEEYLTLSFGTIVVDGQALSTSAVALDPATSKPGVITEIDRKYFQRVILPAAAAFIEGIGGAIAQSGSTTVSAGAGTTTSAENELDTKQEFFKGVEEASGKVSEILDQDGGAVRPMLRVAAGAHLGLLFTQGVERSTDSKGVVLRNQGRDQASALPGGASAGPTQIQTSGTPTGQ